jgi:hypothetical protein
MMEMHLKIIGWLLMLLALIHGIFPRYFNWKNEFSSLSLINREMMYVHTFFIAFVVFLMGILCVTCSIEIVETALGKKLALGLCVFWAVRFFTQFFGYSSALWKGKRFETVVHVVFSLLWAYVSVVFFLCSTGK